LGAFYYGHSSRVYAGAQSVTSVPENLAAVAVWQRQGVKGRVLLLFDRALNADVSRNMDISKDNYIDWALKRNILRKVIHVVPDFRWPEAKKNLLESKLAHYSRGVFSATIDDAPLVVLPLDSLPSIQETVLLHINNDNFSEAQFAEVIHRIRSRSISSDVITVTGKISRMQMSDLTNAIRN